MGCSARGGNESTIFGRGSAAKAGILYYRDQESSRVGESATELISSLRGAVSLKLDLIFDWIFAAPNCYKKSDNSIAALIPISVLAVRKPNAIGQIELGESQML